MFINYRSVLPCPYLSRRKVSSTCTSRPRVRAHFYLNVVFRIKMLCKVKTTVLLIEPTWLCFLVLQEFEHHLFVWMHSGTRCLNEHAPHKDSEDVRILASPRGNVKIPQSTSLMLCKTLDSTTKGIYLI